MKFGPEWIRNLPSEGSTGGGTAGGTKYQLAEFRYVCPYFALEVAKLSFFLSEMYNLI